jgi:hypothetical protein
MDRSLIDATLVEIGRDYKPGLLMWLRSHPDGWARLLQLETTINSTTLAGDEPGLRVALQTYKDFIMEMGKLFEEANSLPLFGRRDHE